MSSLLHLFHNQGRGRPIGSRDESSIRYLLRDEFTTALTAGNVNGTAAEPGPGNRVVADTTSKLSITNSALTLAGGASTVYGDPGLWLGAVTRSAGRLLVTHFKPTTFFNYMRIGLDYDQVSTGGEQYTFQFASGVEPNGDLKAVDPGGVTASLGVYSPNTDYYLAIRLLATGANFYIKGGAWASWTLLYESAVDSGATLYPAVLSYDHVGTVNFMRVPDVLWVPSGTDYSSLDQFIM